MVTPSYVGKRRCRSRSKFGPCGRPAGNHVIHAVPIGDGVWFGYRSTRTTSTPLGYGYFRGDVFVTVTPADAP